MPISWSAFSWDSLQTRITTPKERFRMDVGSDSYSKRTHPPIVASSFFPGKTTPREGNFPGPILSRLPVSSEVSARIIRSLWFSTSIVWLLAIEILGIHPLSTAVLYQDELVHKSKKNRNNPIVFLRRVGIFIVVFPFGFSRIFPISKFLLNNSTIIIKVNCWFGNIFLIEMVDFF